MRRVPSLAVLFFTLSVFPLILRSQSTNASLSDRVTDPAKARIVGAKVAAVNAGTNIRGEATTNAPGEYYLPNLTPGKYFARGRKAWFQKADQAGRAPARARMLWRSTSKCRSAPRRKASPSRRRASARYLRRDREHLVRMADKLKIPPART